MTFDYRVPAELFMAKRKGGARSRFISRRFATAAEAIRFAVEDFPAIRALGAWLQVGKERFDCARHPSSLREPAFSAATPNRLSAQQTIGMPGAPAAPPAPNRQDGGKARSLARAVRGGVRSRASLSSLARQMSSVSGFYPFGGPTGYKVVARLNRPESGSPLIVIPTATQQPRPSRPPGRPGRPGDRIGRRRLCRAEPNSRQTLTAARNGG